MKFTCHVTFVGGGTKPYTGLLVVNQSGVTIPAGVKLTLHVVGKSGAVTKGAFTTPTSMSAGAMVGVPKTENQFYVGTPCAVTLGS
jgi:hypothetical protein